jgi:hypothetical protein
MDASLVGGPAEDNEPRQEVRLPTRKLTGSTSLQPAVLGPVQGWDGLLLATGHFRNGVLLCAITGEIVGALALGEPSPTDISPFLYDKLEDATPLQR